MGTVQSYAPMSDRSPDIAIVGAGVIGLTTAWSLARAGLQVSVYERDPAPRQASWAGAGILSPLVPWEYPPEVQQLALASQGQYPALIESVSDLSGLPVECRPVGMLLQGDEHVVPGLQWSQAHNVDATHLSAVDATTQFPGLGRKEGGIWLPEVMALRSPDWLAALLAALPKLGVTLHLSSAVQQLIVEQGRVTGLSVNGRPVTAGAVVVAAGCWSSTLIAPWLSVDMLPVRGQMLAVQAGKEAPPAVLQHEGCYLVPRQDGLVLCGSSAEQAGFDCQVTDSVQQEIHQRAEAIWPALAGKPVVARWAGLRPATPDGLPCLGVVPGVSGLWLNTGHYRHGITTAPASAEALTREMTSAVGAFPALSPGRFFSG